MAFPLGAIVSGWASGIYARLSREPKHPRDHQAPEVQRTLAGVVVTPENALNDPALNAGIRYISESVAGFPWQVFERQSDGNRHAGTHPIDWLLWKRPNPEWSSFQFRETLIHWAILYGGGFAEIERDVSGRPLALWPIHPDRVQVCRDADNGNLFYEIDNGVGEKVDLRMEDMFHIRGFGHGPVGVPLTAWAAQTLGLSRAAKLFGAAFFGNGMNVSGIVKNKKAMSPDGVKRLRAELEALYRGPARSNRFAIFDNDADFMSISTDPAKSQLVEVQRFLVEEVCRLTGVPPHIVSEMSRATFSNIEHQAIEAVQRCLVPWCRRLEDEADFKLFGQNRRGFYTKLNMNALLRGDMKSRVEFYKGMVQIGAYSPNRVLDLEDENGIGDAGDIHVMQEQMSTLEFIEAKTQKSAAATPSAPSPSDAPADPANPADAAAMAALIARAEALEAADVG